MIAALYTHGRCVTGRHHGEAFEKLSDTERDEELLSGFLDTETGKFVTDGIYFYLKRLLLIRHGEYEPEGDDPPINNDGVEHLRHLGECLSHLDLGGYLCYTSPLRRCRQSAAILSSQAHMHFTVDDDIREWEDNEPLEHFRQRIVHVIEHLPSKALLLTHCDFILHLAYIATGESLHFENRAVPTGSVTVIHDDKILCVGQEAEVLENSQAMLL
jgi:broad specificity phosphatase PhoE